MRILFIYPVPPPYFVYTGFHHGIGYISSVLKNAGHETSLLQTYKYDENEIKNKINSFKPDLVAVSSTTDQIELSKKIIDFIYKIYKLPIVIGGVHATMLPEELINIEGVLGVCRGEGEYAMLELVEALEKGKDHTKIKNFWFKKNGKIVKNPIRPLIQNLDELPFPDREVFEFQKLLDNMRSDVGVEFMGSRGCPFQCSFCINYSLMKLHKNKGKYVRFRTAENLLSEIKKVINKYRNTKKIIFYDEIFTLNKKWLREFCEKYQKEIGLPFECNTRIDTVNKETIDWLKKAGCEVISLGLESGNDYIRNVILRKEVTKNQIMNACSIIKQAGIKIRVFNMVGLPYETEETINETIKVNKIIKPDYVFVSTFTPYPGTELFELCKSKGWISERTVKSYFENISILDQPSISKERVAYYHKIFKASIQHPYLVTFIKILDRIKISKNRSVYDVVESYILKLMAFVARKLPYKQVVFLRKMLKL
jgi:radical SAM superfamily enzyme YgiQ (UPF0313 family)